MQRFLKNIVINLRMCIFCCTVGHWLGFKSNNIVDVISQTIGGRAYPVRHYPIAIRLRDRKGRAILCVVLIPQSGDSSGTTLGVRSVALLHALCSPYSSSFENISQNRLVPYHLLSNTSFSSELE